MTQNEIEQIVFKLHRRDFERESILKGMDIPCDVGYNANRMYNNVKIVRAVYLIDKYTTTEESIVNYYIQLLNMQDKVILDYVNSHIVKKINLLRPIQAIGISKYNINFELIVSFD